MARAPYVLGATVAGTAALLAFHPAARAPATASSGSPAAPSASASGGTTTASGKRYDGDVESNQYGDVQVRVTVRNGKLVDVTALQVPENDPRSAQINGYAAPLLRQEALSAQSAKIDTVSGATYTSESYQASLQTALARAGV